MPVQLVNEIVRGKWMGRLAVCRGFWYQTFEIIEREGPRTVEGGIPAFDDERKGQRGVWEAAIAGFLSDAPRLEDDVPVEMPGDVIKPHRTGTMYPSSCSKAKSNSGR